MHAKTRRERGNERGRDEKGQEPHRLHAFTLSLTTVLSNPQGPERFASDGGPSFSQALNPARRIAAPHSGHRQSAGSVFPTS